MKKIIINTIFIIYLVLTIAVTGTLLSFNEKNIALINNNYILTLNDSKEYSKNDLLIIKKNNKAKENEKIFYYDNKKIKTNKVKKIDKKKQTIVLENETIITNEEVLGNIKETTRLPLLGQVYNTLTSRLGYLFIIILPMLLAFVYEIYAITKELKKK